MATKLNTKNTITGAVLKQFRHNVSILKKKGILKNELYDARSVIPTKYLNSQIKKFESVINGTAQAVKVTAEKKKHYEKMGYMVKGSAVIVPVRKNERVFAHKGDFRISLKAKGGTIIKIDKGMDAENINEWVDNLKNNRVKLKSDEILAVQLYGNNMHRTFHPGGGLTAQERLAMYLMQYEAGDEMTSTPEKMAEFVKGIVVFKINRDKKTGEYPKLETNSFAKEKDAELRARHRERERARREKRLSQLTDKAYDKYMVEKAEAARQRRKEMTPKELEDYRAKSKARAAKSRAKKQN